MMAPAVAPELNNAGGQRALAARKPVGGCLHRGGKVARLAEPKEHAGDAEAERGADEGVTHRRETPRAHDGGIANARSQPVDQPSCDDEADGIGNLEDGHNMPIAHLGQADAVLQRGLEDADDLPIHVVDRRRDKEHRADGPPDVADALGRRTAVAIGFFVCRGIENGAQCGSVVTACTRVAQGYTLGPVPGQTPRLLPGYVP